jgi:hypothetical protein
MIMNLIELNSMKIRNEVTTSASKVPGYYMSRINILAERFELVELLGQPDLAGSGINT